ncbi:MAG: SMI1/KNR4 family protein [Gemmataceae bacterium]|nr:SMI1/KNR4 family protein [Gemmataceae bacterium]
MEEQLGVILPDSYRDFLLGYNGGFFNEPRNLLPGARMLRID